ncbi:hypothetical protein C8Q78DRAFT_1083987 [Trametes maxima]|nr:hypothetical protein C8Q78DRAFT_1083987 [Trametes maxima]
MDPAALARRCNLVNYSFSGSVELSKTGTTCLPFVSVKAPFASQDPNRLPTILHQFGPEGELGPLSESALGIMERPESQTIGHRLPFVRQSTPAPQSNSASRHATPAPQSNSASRHATPVPQNLRSRGTTPAPSPSVQHGSASLPPSRASSVPPASNFESPVAEATHQTTGYIPSACGHSVPPYNFEDYLPQSASTQKSSISLRRTRASSMKRVSSAASAASSDITVHSDPDPMGFIRQFKLCQLTDEEKSSNRKGKSQQERPYTAWFESAGDEPRVSPPNLTARPDLELGDIFYHKSPVGIQLWVLYEVPDEGKQWKPVLLGHLREADSRRLGLTPSSKPSWCTEAWYHKISKEPPTTRVFILKKN